MSESPTIGQRREILAYAEQLVTRRRQADVDELVTLLVWADSHAFEPRGEGARPRGGPRLVQLGGDGTPQVLDLCLAEMAIARQSGEVATRNLTADALDLRHRLPKVWAHLQALACEGWVARKVARLSRSLSRDAVALVDEAVADAIGQSPARLLTIAEAKVIEADQAAHAARIEQNRHQKGVWFSSPQPGELVDEASGSAGVRMVFGRLDDADALELEQTISDLAGLLAARADYGPDEQPTWDQLRAESLGLLARPAEALNLLRGDEPADTAEPVATSTGHHDRRRAKLIVHVSAETLCGAAAGIARVEGLGPMLREQVIQLLRHCRVDLLPMLDLSDLRAVTGYEHPTDVRARTMARTGGDVFPHSSARVEARIDHDHPRPYEPTGPPGQTGDHNDAPLTRRHHRAKTHLGYRVDQLAPGAYRWVTPAGLARVVTPRGTRCVTLLTTGTGQVAGEVYQLPVAA